MTPYRRRAATAHDGLMAAAAGFVVGSVVFYLTRTWLRREELPPMGDRGGGGRAARVNGAESRADRARDGRADRPGEARPRGHADAGAP